MRQAAFLLALLCAIPVQAQTRVSVPAGDVALLGFLNRPTGPGPFPGIVAMHGCAGMFARDGSVNPRDADWTRRLVADGHVVLQIDSFGARGVRETCTLRDPPVKPERERAADAYAALAYLQSLDFVRADRIGLLGWSHGAMSALNAADLGNPGRPAALPKIDFAASVVFYPGCFVLRDKQPAWRPAFPILFLLGEKDNWTRPGFCQQLVGRASRAGAALEIVTYSGAYHDFDAPDMPLRERRGIASVSDGAVMIGTDPAARADALIRAPAFFARYLKN